MAQIARIELWKHQQRMVDFASGKSGVIFNACMGSGKSGATVRLLEGPWGSRKVLVLCPKAVVGTVWGRAIGLFGSKDWTVLELDQASIPARMKALKVGGSGWRAAGYPGPLCVVLNYEAIRSGKMFSLLESVKFDTIVFDESHRIRGPKAAVSKAAARLASKIGRRIGLTGTLYPRDVLDGFAQMRAVAPDVYGKSWFKHRREYSVMGGFQAKQVVGFRNTDRLMSLAKDVVIVVTEEDANLNLPPMRDEVVSLRMSRTCRKVYADIEADSVALVKSGMISASNGLTRLLRLMQIASGIAVSDVLNDLGEVESRTVEIVDTAKRDYLVDLFTDCGTEPQVVFAVYKPELAMIREAAEMAGVTHCEVSGAHKDLARFQSGECQVVGVQIGAGAEGVDLTRAAHVVIMNSGLDRGKLEQALKRAHRPGQDRPVLNTFLLMEDTVEVAIAQNHKTKRAFVDAVLERLRSC